jgi:hypothetical protein
MGTTFRPASLRRAIAATTCSGTTPSVVSVSSISVSTPSSFGVLQFRQRAQKFLAHNKLSMLILA